MSTQILRSKNKWLAGVCSGLANHFQIPTWIVRTTWVFGVLFVIPFLFYFICALSLPMEGKTEEFYKPKILGVCFDLSKISGIDLAIVRLCALSLALMSFGVVFLIYVGLRFVLEKTTPTQN